MGEPLDPVEGVSDVWLAQTYGALIQARDVAKLLGFNSPAALRRANATGRLPVRLFKRPGRRGMFAYAGDVGLYLRASVASRDDREEESSMT